MSCRCDTVEGVEPIARRFLSPKTYPEFFSCQGGEGFLVRQPWALHRAFDLRQQGDYGEATVAVDIEDATELLESAQAFVAAMQRYVGNKELIPSKQ